MNNKQLGILLLILALVIAMGYIIYLKFQDYEITEQEKIENMTIGNYTRGAVDAGNILLNQLINDALQCKAIPLNYLDQNNQTRQINLIAIECLKQKNPN